MPDPIVIDSCAMEDRDFRSWLYHFRGRKILPMVAFVEVSLHLLYHGRSHEQIEHLMYTLGIEIEPFKQSYARQAADTLRDSDRKEVTADRDWIRDHMIGAHAHTAPLKLVTNNTMHFSFLGTRVLTPEQAKREL